MTDQTAGWNKIIASLPGAHFLQTLQWAEVKNAVGWQRQEFTWCGEDGEVSGAAQLLVRTMRLLKFGPKISVGYVPRGPLVDWDDPMQRVQALDSLEKHAWKSKLVFIKIDPEVVLGCGIEDSLDSEDTTGTRLKKELHQRGWRYSSEQIQFKNTMMLDLSGSEEDWMSRMKQKTRYNIRLAIKNGVTVRQAGKEDLPLLYKMYAETANRDGFIIRPADYYLDVWDRFIKADMAEGLVAEYDGIPLAGLFYFYLGTRAWYVYGMSKSLHREKMPAYLLQWEAMRAAKQKGCTVYDMWGAPDKFDSTDSLYGVYRFKEGLGAEVVRTIGAWDFPVQPFIYFTYQRLIPRLLDVTRWIRRRKIKQEVL